MVAPLDALITAQSRLPLGQEANVDRLGWVARGDLVRPGQHCSDVDLGAPVHCYPALTADANLIVGARNGTLSVIR